MSPVPCSAIISKHQTNLTIQLLKTEKKNGYVLQSVVNFNGTLTGPAESQTLQRQSVNISLSSEISIWEKGSCLGSCCCFMLLLLPLLFSVSEFSCLRQRFKLLWYFFRKKKGSLIIHPLSDCGFQFLTAQIFWRGTATIRSSSSSSSSSSSTSSHRCTSGGHPLN